MLAFTLAIPELALDESKGEHEKLARAVSRVASHYNIPMLDPITRDWLMLAKTAGMIYGTRCMAFYLRTRAENARPVNAARPAARPAAPPQAASPSPANPPREEPRFADVVVPGFEHMGAQKVRLN